MRALCWKISCFSSADRLKVEKWLNYLVEKVWGWEMRTPRDDELSLVSPGIFSPSCSM